MLEPPVLTGHLIPYHTVGRPALRRGRGSPHGGRHLPTPHSSRVHRVQPHPGSFSPDPAYPSPRILGGHAARGDFDLDPGTLAATNALVQASPPRTRTFPDP